VPGLHGQLWQTAQRLGRRAKIDAGNAGRALKSMLSIYSALRPVAGAPFTKLSS